MAVDSFIITCEHGGNRIPAAYRFLFSRQQALLNTHRGYDPGALVLARTLAKAQKAPLVISTISRLLVDLNRSHGHPQLYSEATRNTSAGVRAQILNDYYLPYRMRVEGLVRCEVAQGRRVIHISAHTFTPVLHGEVRNADVGLLYDPSRAGESELCARWKVAFTMHDPDLRVRRNYPYLGKGDGLTSHLRRRFTQEVYVGIELEVNQRIVATGGQRWSALRGVVINTLRTACGTN